MIQNKFLTLCVQLRLERHGKKEKKRYDCIIVSTLLVI